MSKKNPNYRNSFADKFTRWVKGDYDPIAGQMEMIRKSLVMRESVTCIYILSNPTTTVSVCLRKGLPRMSEGLQAFIRFLVQLWQSLLPVCFFGR